MKIVLKVIMKRLSIVLFFILTGWVMTQNLQAEPSKEHVMSMLQGYEWSINSEKLLSLGSDVDLVLIEIAADTTLMNMYRFRALEALGLFTGNRVANYLENHIDENQNASHQRRAFESLSVAFSSTQPDRVEATAKELLNHDNPSVRIAAARSLNELNTSSAQSTFQDFMESENQSWVKKKVLE